MTFALSHPSGKCVTFRYQSPIFWSIRILVLIESRTVWKHGIPKAFLGLNIIMAGLKFKTSHTAFLEVSQQVVLQIQADRYDLKDPLALARFLQDADIRLVRAKFGPQMLVIFAILMISNHQ